MSKSSWSDLPSELHDLTFPSLNYKALIILANESNESGANAYLHKIARRYRKYLTIRDPDNSHVFREISDNSLVAILYHISDCTKILAEELLRGDSLNTKIENRENLRSSDRSFDAQITVKFRHGNTIYADYITTYNMDRTGPSVAIYFKRTRPNGKSEPYRGDGLPALIHNDEALLDA